LEPPTPDTIASTTFQVLWDLYHVRSFVGLLHAC
jgi:hypothetical protein